MRNLVLKSWGLGVIALLIPACLFLSKCCSDSCNTTSANCSNCGKTSCEKTCPSNSPK